jgi:hypothetical protein
MHRPVAVFIEKATPEWPQKFGIEVKMLKEMAHGSPRIDADALVLNPEERC